MIALSYLLEDFLSIITSFPAIIYSVLLTVTIILALLTIVGLLDIDGPEFDFNMDGDVDLSANAPTAEGLAGFMLSWGLTGVPITIVFCVLSLVGWFICYYAVYLTFDYIPDGVLEYLMGAVILVISFFVSLPITAFMIRPLRGLFSHAQAKSNKHILGQVAVIRSSKVTAIFGEATFNDGGAGLLLRVRNGDDNTLKKGDAVVLLEYNKTDGTYLVIPESEFTY
jgi:hypothetical protein|tara:strand:- start:2111 stop:2785 length:675 start_codon:yes stop_codon:yes gene_type:complete